MGIIDFNINKTMVKYHPDIGVILIKKGRNFIQILTTFHNDTEVCWHLFDTIEDTIPRNFVCEQKTVVDNRDGKKYISYKFEVIQ